jgi:hypothetical protein
MTMLVDFFDGFTSNSEPEISSGGSVYSQINDYNVTPSELFNVNIAAYRSVFVMYELERSNNLSKKIQSGVFQAHYDGSGFVLTYGNYSGNDMFITSTPSNEQVQIVITSVGGGVFSFRYISGSMGGTNYNGSLKMLVNKLRVV